MRQTEPGPQHFLLVRAAEEPALLQFGHQSSGDRLQVEANACLVIDVVKGG